MCAMWFSISVVEFRLCGRWFDLQVGWGWGDHGIQCWWDLIRSKQYIQWFRLLSAVFAEFSGNGNSVYCCDTIEAISRGIRDSHLFLGYLNVSTIAWPEFELAYLEAVIKHFIHFTTETTPYIVSSIPMSYK